MAQWIARLASWKAMALAEAWLMGRPAAPRRPATRPLRPEALSPHLMRDIGLLDAASGDGGDAHGRMGRRHHLG